MISDLSPLLFYTFLSRQREISAAREPLRRRTVKLPLIAPLVAFAMGITAARLLGLDSRSLFLALSALIALAVLASRFAPRLLLGSALAAATFAGALLQTLHRPRPAPEIDAGARELVILSGCVVNPTIFSEGRDQFIVELAPHARTRVTMTVRDGETPLALHYGQRIEFEARIRAARNFQNPGAFDYQGYLARTDIYWTASIPAGGALSILPGRCGSPLTAAIFAIRGAALDRIERLYAGNQYATGMMEATLIGETGKLDRIWTENFRRTGTYHMLVIDGLHITILAAFLLFLLRLCFVPEITALAITASGAWLYAAVSGWNAPALRAAGGFALYVMARYFYRRGRFLNLLAAAAIVYLAFDPGQLLEPGFQLSFLAVAAIGAFAVPILESTTAPYSAALRGVAETSRDPRLAPLTAQFRVELRLLAETLHYYARIPETWILRFLALSTGVAFYAFEIAVVSTTIQIAVALPMAIYFHRISLTGLSANILAVPLLGLVVPAGFVAVFTGWHAPAQLAAWLLAAGQKVAEWHTRFEPAWRVVDPPSWLTIAFTASLLLLVWALRRRGVLLWAGGALVLTLFALVFVHPFPADVRRGQLELTTIDVGQGDSLLVAFPDGKLMLVDAGGLLSFGGRVPSRFDIGEDVVSPYLWTRSIRKLDVVVLTHAHDDHARGLPAVLENFHPAQLWTGVAPPCPAWSAVAAKAHEQGVQVVPMRSGRHFSFGGAQIDVLSPPPDYPPGDGPANNDSLALRLTYRQRSFLLTGDMEKPMEARLLDSGLDLRADVLKVGHHGSNTSSTASFLSAVSPTFAVISDGYANSFHHPHPQVLSRLQADRVGVYRTDVQGLITIRTDGKTLSIETFQGSEASHNRYPGSVPDF